MARCRRSNLLSLIAPNYFNSLDGFGLYWGPGGRGWHPDDWTEQCEVNYLYVGLLPILLLVVHGLIGRRLFAAPVRFYSAVLLASALYALGRYTPVFKIAFDYVRSGAVPSPGQLDLHPDLRARDVLGLSHGPPATRRRARHPLARMARCGARRLRRRDRGLGGRPRPRSFRPCRDVPGDRRRHPRGEWASSSGRPPDRDLTGRSG